MYVRCCVVVDLLTALVEEPVVETPLLPEELTSPDVVLRLSRTVAFFVLPPSVVRLLMLFAEDEVDLRVTPTSCVELLFRRELPSDESRVPEEDLSERATLL